MSILAVENLYKTYGEKVLFNDISFSVSDKDRIGLIGVNGTGKSTLLKVIADMDSAEKGKVIHANEFHIEYVPQYAILDEQLTVIEQIYYGESELMKTLKAYEYTLSALASDPESKKIQGQLFSIQQKMDQLNAWEASTVAKTVLTRLGIKDFTQKVSELSGGQKKRISIAKALIQPANLLILDEPTNHLDHDAVEWLESFLAQYNGAIMLVTHDRYFLNRVTNKIFELDQGNLYEYEGNYETFLEKKAEREEVAVNHESKRKNLLRKELAWLRRGAKARTTKQKARIQRVEELQTQKGPASKGKVDISLGSNRLGKKILELKDVSKGYGDNKLINDFSYLVTQNERLGIIGANGSGKSTLLNILAGRIEPDTGTVTMGETVKIGYYTQENIEIDGNLRVIEYIKQVAEIVKTSDGQEITAEQMLERFLFSRPVQWSYIRTLSGGERRRLYLLRILIGEPNVLFLDEPTNDLDTETLSILEDYLNDFPGVVITVSHDRYFLDRVVDHLLVFKEEGNISRFQGNYSEYLEKKQEETTYASQPQKEAKKPERKERRKKLSYHEQKEWDGIEAKIDELESLNDELQVKIAEAGSDIGKVQEFHQKQQEVEKQLEQTVERWTELSMLIEQFENEEA